MSLPPEKILLRWMNFQLKKAGYKKIVTNFSSDIKVDDEKLEFKEKNLFVFSSFFWSL
jgi:hypothetical protein